MVSIKDIQCLIINEFLWFLICIGYYVHSFQILRYLFSFTYTRGINYGLIIISSHFIPQNVRLLRGHFLPNFTGRAQHNFRVLTLIPWEICKIYFYPFPLSTLVTNLVEKTGANLQLVFLKTLDFVTTFLMFWFFSAALYIQHWTEGWNLNCWTFQICDKTNIPTE